jgi:hypothetical protein
VYSFTAGQKAVPLKRSRHWSSAGCADGRLHLLLLLLLHGQRCGRLVPYLLRCRRLWWHLLLLLLDLLLCRLSRGCIVCC